MTLPGPATAASGFFVRGVGSTRIVPTSASSINTLGLVCGPAGTAGDGNCVASATATMKISAGTKHSLDLPSTTIAKGTSKPAGEGVAIKMVAKKSVRNKLKTVSSVKVTYTVTATSPITETFKTTVTMKRTGTPKRLLIRSSGDTFDFSGGEGG